MQKTMRPHESFDEARKSTALRSVITSIVTIGMLTASLGKKIQESINYSQSNLPTLKKKADKIRLPWQHALPPSIFPDMPSAHGDDGPADALDALQKAEYYQSESDTDFLRIAAGESLLNRTMTMTFSIENATERITFCIDQDPSANTLVFRVNDRLFVTAQRIPWLFFARPDDIIEEVTAMGDGGVLLKSQRIGTAVIPPMEVCRALLLLRDSDTPHVTLEIEAMVKAKEGSEAEKIAKEQGSSIIQCTMYLKYAGQHVESQNLAVTAP